MCEIGRAQNLYAVTVFFLQVLPEVCAPHGRQQTFDRWRLLLMTKLLTMMVVMFVCVCVNTCVSIRLFVMDLV